MIYCRTKRVKAANKAVNTLRLNLLLRANFDEVKQLSHQIISKEFEIDDDFSKDGIIAREVDKTTWQSFCRFGSRRNATKGLILSWIENKSIPLDEQAMFISEHYSMEILPDELAEFILNNHNGKSGYPPYSELEEMKKTFRYLAGFNWNLKFVRDEIIKIHKYSPLKDMPF